MCGEKKMATEGGLTIFVHVCLLILNAGMVTKNYCEHGIVADYYGGQNKN